MNKIVSSEPVGYMVECVKTNGMTYLFRKKWEVDDFISRGPNSEGHGAKVSPLYKGVDPTIERLKIAYSHALSRMKGFAISIRQEAMDESIVLIEKELAKLEGDQDE